MKQKAVVQIQTVAVNSVHEPIMESVLLKGVLVEGMEAIKDGVVIVITLLQTLSGETVSEFVSINQRVNLIIDISNPSKLQELIGESLTFSIERSIPLVDSIQSWQTESTT